MMTDRVLTGLEMAEHQLMVELDRLNQLLEQVRQLITARKASVEPMRNQLLCEMVHDIHDALALAAWENEGGAIR